MATWSAFRRRWLPWEVYPVVFATGAGVTLGIGELYNKVLRNPSREYCAKMSRGGDGTLEGVQGAMPAISLMEGRSTAIFANDRPFMTRGRMIATPPPAVEYEVVEDDPAEYEPIEDERVGVDESFTANEPSNTSTLGELQEKGAAVAHFVTDAAQTAKEEIVKAAETVEEDIGKVADTIFEEVENVVASEPETRRPLASIQLTKVEDMDKIIEQPELVEIEVEGTAGAGVAGSSSK